MVKQYPYKLEILEIKESIKDGNGDFLESTSQWIFITMCRDEAGSGKLIQGTDGNVYSYSSLIQCPKETKVIEAGAKVRVIDIEGNIRVSGPIIYSRQDQLHTRIWL